MHVVLPRNAARCGARVTVHEQGRQTSSKCCASRCCANYKSPSASPPCPALSPRKSSKRGHCVQLYGPVALYYLTAGNCSEALAADIAAASQPYVPSPANIGWEVWVGAIAGVIPFAIGSYQFVARILIQRRCPRCSGSGLVERGPFLRKCPECGGFFPWQGWKQFLTSTATPGNGGVLRQPRNQGDVIYKIPPKAKDKDQNKS
ncbi:hypothetical protein ABBQ32_010001 [Trebouxia sp. C0010 RCD-2024]